VKLVLRVFRDYLVLMVMTVLQGQQAHRVRQVSRVGTPMEMVLGMNLVRTPIMMTCSTLSTVKGHKVMRVQLAHKGHKEYKVLQGKTE